MLLRLGPKSPDISPSITFWLFCESLNSVQIRVHIDPHIYLIFSSDEQPFKDFPWLSEHAYKQDYGQKKNKIKCRRIAFSLPPAAAVLFNLFPSITFRHEYGGGDKHQGRETPGGNRKENAWRRQNIKAPSVSWRSETLLKQDSFSYLCLLSLKLHPAAERLSCWIWLLSPCRCRSSALSAASLFIHADSSHYSPTYEGIYLSSSYRTVNPARL